jgi:hypothetical protein
MTDQRTWVFIADRKMNEEEAIRINDELQRFVSNWKTHGTPIDASGFCFEHAAIVIAANEAEVKASGCSIDKINQLVHSLGSTLDIDFFNRFNVLHRMDSGQWDIERYSPHNANSCINANIISLNQLNQLIIN